MARTSNNTEVAVQEPESPMARTKRVIVQKTSDIGDTHITLGFNSWTAHVPYGVPVEMPADAVDYFRKQVRYVTAPGDKGQLTAHAVQAVSIVDA